MSTNLASPPFYRSSHTPAFTRRKWFIDLHMRKNERLASTTSSSLVSASSSSYNSDYSLPVGYSDQRIADVPTQDEDERLFAKRSWDIALQPVKQLPMNLIFAWMAGNLTHLALALYKCQSMGLLPTYASDWIAFAEAQLNVETTFGGLAY
ncbi:unnamed protein product [Didymodactylos carnosus]|uniref:ER membrane protein complex subunit 4 n=1 Tax=Didymodactylos carnosus TaxID=1234261 RepID=A0A814C982_9BILA|nr:unnamed protein product [Didymodactylos carnosus]CAF0936940.1 unnamed protein product [Didymodactylos carnosus]CAF3659927.1 unnamed protein product [Didymodactylos carnosus]CAF3713990.1 unnamed protein product [Didymodactylos carnosus]